MLQTKKAPVANGAAVVDAPKEVKKAAAAPKSPAKTVTTKKDAPPKKATKAESASTKSEKKNAESQAKLVAEAKPDDFDDGTNGFNALIGCDLLIT